MARAAHGQAQPPVVVPLPPARLDGAVSVERALLERHSVREFGGADVTVEQLAQLLWAAQGVTHGRGRRAAPSAGALYPLEVFVLTGPAVRGLPPAVYHYDHAAHSLEQVAAGDSRRALYEVALEQDCVADGALVVVFTAVEHRTTRKYGPRAMRYILIEVGHAAQNVLLQATALGLGCATVGAFSDAKVAKLLQLPDGHLPLYIVPIGPLADAQPQ